jgi:hypothetical protein
MPYTKILLVTRKAGISPQQFKDHWEHNHIALLKGIVGEDFPLSHTRHYFERDNESPYTPNVLYGTAEDFTCDAIAVFTFANKAHWDRFVAKCSEPKNAAKLSEDDSKFLDQKKLKGVLVGDTRSTGRDGGSMGWRFVGSI